MSLLLRTLPWLPITCKTQSKFWNSRSSPFASFATSNIPHVPDMLNCFCFPNRQASSCLQTSDILFSLPVCMIKTPTFPFRPNSIIPFSWNLLDQSCTFSSLRHRCTAITALLYHLITLVYFSFFSHWTASSLRTKTVYSFWGFDA